MCQAWSVSFQQGMHFHLRPNLSFLLMSHKSPEIVAVQEKIHAGIWAFNGFFRLTDCWQERDDARSVFKYRLELAEDVDIEAAPPESLPPTRMIPSAVKLEVWQRDKGRCVICGQEDNLHFDHDLPFSQGRPSLTPKNIRLLCARHDLSKSGKIQ